VAENRAPDLPGAPKFEVRNGLDCTSADHQVKAETGNNHLQSQQMQNLATIPQLERPSSDRSTPNY
jgi:hypothetical protein